MFAYPSFKVPVEEEPDRRRARHQLRKDILDLHYKCSKNNFSLEHFVSDKYVHAALIPLYEAIFNEEVQKIEGGDQIKITWDPFSAQFKRLVLEFNRIPDKNA